MAHNLIVCYDPEKELGCVVDATDRIGYGPAAIGPEAGVLLEAWLATIPYDISGVSAYTLRDWFEAFRDSELARLAAQAGQADTRQMDNGPGDKLGPAALAEHTATESRGEPPEPQPADTDMEADESEADQVTGNGAEPPPMSDEVAEAVAQYEGPCPVCNGTGSLPNPTGEGATTCNLCTGTGHLPAPVAS